MPKLSLIVTKETPEGQNLGRLVNLALVVSQGYSGGLTMTLPHRRPPVHPQKAGLQFLLTYARQHYHSAAWIAPLTRLLGKGGAAHG